MRLDDAVSLWDVHYILKWYAVACCFARRLEVLRSGANAV
jgi:hypothetical protein